MKVNLFQVQDSDFKVLLDKFGSTIKVNNVDTKAVITNTSINEWDDKYISTSTQLKRGDHILVQGKDWYVISQVKTKRYESYKAIIRCAEHYIRFNMSVKDAPNSTYVSYDIKEIPCIVQTTSDFGLDGGRQVILGEGELAIFAQDNATTRAIFESFTESSRKHDIVIDNRQYAYQGFDFISKGLVRINVKVTSSSQLTDKVNSIHWQYDHANWDGVIDSSFYN
ncbi:hypothetical protein M4D70_08145 [Brevibacillus borstelensis]|uniref:hypothetical protein n=1 Tax=Brevibacillus borstelensis TaxID=45462 RepID=UPI0004699D6C|nr:hypothetical protein [Brevibacillus borstelensis]MCM3622228.1 hypothetical protein [Brevibacillus borstelensis]